MKKLLFAVGLILLAQTAFGQTNRFEQYFRTASGPLTGAEIYIVVVETGDSLILTEVNSTTKPGLYRRDDVPWGTLKVYIDGSLSTNDIAFGVPDSTITKPRLSQALIDYIDGGGGGTINNNPDDVTIETNVSSELQIKDGGVSTAKIANDAVTAAKIADEAVSTTEIKQGAIDSSHISAAEILWSHFKQSTKDSVTANGGGGGGSGTVKGTGTAGRIPIFAASDSVTTTPGLAYDTTAYEYTQQAVDDGTPGTVQKFIKDSATPAIGDTLMRQIVQGRDLGAALVDYFEVLTTVANPAATDQEVTVKYLANVNAVQQALLKLSTIAQAVFEVNPDRVDIDFIVRSVDDADAFIINGTTGLRGFGKAATTYPNEFAGSIALDVGDKIYFGTDGTHAAFDSLYWVFTWGADTVALIDTLGTLLLPEHASPPTTGVTGFGRFHVKTDGKPYFINESDTEFDLSDVPASGGSAYADSFTTAGVKHDFDDHFTAAGLKDTTNMVDANWEEYINNHHTKADTGWIPVMLDTVWNGRDISFGGVIPTDVEFVGVYGSTDTGTAPFQIVHRPWTAAQSGGVNVLSSSLTADSDGEYTASFNDATVDRQRHLRVTFGTPTGDPGEVAITAVFVRR